MRRSRHPRTQAFKVGLHNALREAFPELREQSSVFPAQWATGPGRVTGCVWVLTKSEGFASGPPRGVGLRVRYADLNPTFLTLGCTTQPREWPAFYQRVINALRERLRVHGLHNEAPSEPLMRAYANRG